MAACCEVSSWYTEEVLVSIRRASVWPFSAPGFLVSNCGDNRQPPNTRDAAVGPRNSTRSRAIGLRASLQTLLHHDIL